MDSLNSNHQASALIDTNKMVWQLIEARGGQLKILERFGRGSARSTGLIKYDPASQFPIHINRHGFEAFVLSGYISDEFGEYGPGTYLRFPAERRNVMASQSGATVFYKCGHMLAYDKCRHVTRPSDYKWRTHHNSDVRLVDLAACDSELTRLVSFRKSLELNLGSVYGGFEIFVIDGVMNFEISGKNYPCKKNCWMRMPHNTRAVCKALSKTTVWVKRGHLAI